MYLKRRQYSDPVGRIQSQRYSDIYPEVEPIDSSVAYTAKRTYATIDCPIRKRRFSRPGSHCNTDYRSFHSFHLCILLSLRLKVIKHAEMGIKS